MEQFIHPVYGDFSKAIMGLDFDGTVTTHEYPLIGKDLPYCIATLKRFVACGGKICLNTMRSGKELDQAVKYLEKNGVELWGVNCNPDQHKWTKSTKVYAHFYIDDAALGSFTMQDQNISDRPYIDWAMIDALLFPEPI